MDKISTAAEAMSNVKNGSLVAANFWGPGSPFYLWRALMEHDVKDLTVCTNNYVPKPDALKDKGSVDPAGLIDKTDRIIAAFAAIREGEASAADEIIRRVHDGSLKFESMSHGILVDRLYAGAMKLGGFYSPLGIGTVVEEGKEKRTIDGIEYLFEKPIAPDVGLVKAAKADTRGNLVYTGTARAGNPLIAMASKYTIAEVFDIVEPGELDPEMIVTPGIFVDKIVRIPEDDLESMQRRMELVLERIKHRQEREAEKLAERGAL